MHAHMSGRQESNMVIRWGSISRRVCACCVFWSPAKDITSACAGSPEITQNPWHPAPPAAISTRSGGLLGVQVTALFSTWSSPPQAALPAHGRDEACCCVLIVGCCWQVAKGWPLARPAAAPFRLQLEMWVPGPEPSLELTP